MFPQPPVGLLDDRRAKLNINSANHHLTQAYVVNSFITEGNGCKVLCCHSYVWWLFVGSYIGNEQPLFRLFFFGVSGFLFCFVFQKC